MTDRDEVMEKYRDQIEAHVSRTTNRHADSLARLKLPFKGSNMYAEWKFPDLEEAAPVYVVYSYGEHFPMYIWEPLEDVWFNTTDDSTPSTNKHRSAVYPGEHLSVDLDIMNSIIAYGIKHTMKEVLEGKL